MPEKFHYSLFDKICFYISYLFYKLILPFEVKEPRIRLWLYEMAYTLAKFKDYNLSIPYTSKNDIIITKFGTFKIRQNTSDAANVSPAFERRDQNYLRRLLTRLCNHNKKVLFLDIGGDLGSYSVMVGNAFRNNAVSIHCFEPITESCRLIKENLALNRLEDRVKLFETALLDEDNPHARMTLDVGTPGSSTMKDSSAVNTREITITTSKLDTILGDSLSQYDAVVGKIDVEGVERDVLCGAEAVIHSGKEVYVMIEDFINPDIITYMERNGWSFCAKVTSYNSWWYYCKK